ncbi:hypothetical protein [Bradyrhizobium sp. Gha]|uniref:hypothetical protein n=1 Tax=Bradyrhizobium sp. Gha TaxID=1855318 RepID=UPI0011604737|nr:hypothetical protein [Bradyrhizobium sp. Gha]
MTIWEGDSILSGLTAEQRAEITEIWLRKFRGAQLRDIEDQGEAIDVLQAVVNFAQSAMYRASGVRTPAEFESWLSS